MFKKLSAITLAALLLNTVGAGTIYARTQDDKQARHVEKVKDAVRRVGVGEKARVEVRLYDKTKLGGYVREAGADSFVVVDKKTGAANTVAYQQVKQIKGQNLSTGAQVAIGFGVAAALTVLVITLLHALPIMG